MSGGRVGHSTTEEGAKGAAERLVFFSRAVVAIALTLLAIELPVPEGASVEELRAAFEHGFPEYLAFLISFLVIFLHWNGHHRSFRYLTDSPPALVRWNGLWLFSVVLTLFVTKVLTGGHGEGTGFAWRFSLYALVQVVAGVASLLTLRTMRREQVLEPGVPPDLVDHSFVRILGQPVYFTLLRLWRRRTDPTPDPTRED